MKDLFEYEEVRALFWKQPFATLMFYGKIETRKWDTAYRGKVLICSSLEPYKKSHTELMCTSTQLNEMFKIERLEYDWLHPGQGRTLNLKGYAIGIGELAEVRPMRVEDTGKAYVAFNEQLFAHVYKNVQRIHPFPLKGFQGRPRLISQEVKDKIKLL